MSPHQIAQSQADDEQKPESTREGSGTAAQSQDPGLLLSKFVFAPTGEKLGHRKLGRDFSART
eukprot:1165156-Prymnesium_polylepis.1